MLANTLSLKNRKETLRAVDTSIACLYSISVKINFRAWLLSASSETLPLLD
jgi:hypothetical protein